MSFHIVSACRYCSVLLFRNIAGEYPRGWYPPVGSVCIFTNKHRPHRTFKSSCLCGVHFRPVGANIVFSSADHMLFYHSFSGLILPNVLGIGQSYFVHPQTVLQISIPFSGAIWANRPLVY